MFGRENTIFFPNRASLWSIISGKTSEYHASSGSDMLSIRIYYRNFHTWVRKPRTVLIPQDKSINVTYASH